MTDHEYENKKTQFEKLTGYNADENVVAYLTYLNTLKLEKIESQIADFIAKND